MRLLMWIGTGILSRVLRSAWVRRARTVTADTAGPLGKAKMVLQVAVLLVLITFDLSGVALYVPLYAMVALTVASGVEIGLRARRRMAPVAARAPRVAAGAR